MTAEVHRPFPASPRVGVVVVSFNSADHVDGLARTLPAALAGVSHQVIVVDNASTDDSVQRFSTAGFDVVPAGGNLGYAGGLNLGLRLLADVDAILVLNPDIELGVDCVRELLRALDDPWVGVAVPQTRDPATGSLSFTQRSDPTVARSFGTMIGGLVHHIPALSESVLDEQRYLMDVDIDWGVGSAMLISRACLDAVGEWDESFFLYSEETDYCQRARAAGFGVRYVSRALSFHTGGGGVNDPRLRSMMQVNRVRLYARSHAAPSTAVFFAFVVLGELFRSFTGRRASRSALVALLRPSHRPPELKCSTSFLPR